METISVGQIVRLPHGEPVKVEIIYDDGDARVRRITGERAGTIALCRISKLLPIEDENEPAEGSSSGGREGPPPMLRSLGNNRAGS